MAQFTCPHPSPRIKYTSPSAPLIHTRLLIASELDKQFEAYYFTRAMRQQQPEWRDGPSTMTPARIAEIFQVNLWEPSNKEPVPKLSQKNFLSLFYYADEQYIHWVRTLSVLANIIPSTGRFNHLVNRIHQAQRILLDTINVIYITMPDSHKSSRSYRAILPDAERHELAAIGFSEPILFTAQALTRGYVVRGLEIYTSTLRGPAEQLCATFEALRFVFRQNALANEKARGRCLFWNRVTTTTAPEPSYRALWSVLSDFDRAWAAFESKICECHMASMSGARSFTRQTDVRADRNTMKLEPLAEHDMFVTLLSETMLRALERGYVSRDQVARCDPAVIVAVPRLAVVAGLVWMPDMFQVADENADGRRSGFRWFSNHLERLRTIQCAIQALGDSEIELLEWLLAGSGDQATAEKRDAFIQRIFTDVCVVADALQSGPRAKEFLDVLRCAFELNV